ncbi:protein Flattop, partial [Discoglossus pictus]
FQSAFNPSKLQNWTISKIYKEVPSTHDGYTQFIANDRGHLLPGAPRSKVSPWGTFMGTWDMPAKIPPSKLNLTSRSVKESKRLTDWVQSSAPLIGACNGLRPEVTGKPSGTVEERPDVTATLRQETSQRHSSGLKVACKGDRASPTGDLKEQCLDKNPETRKERSSYDQAKA